MAAPRAVSAVAMAAAKTVSAAARAATNRVLAAARAILENHCPPPARGRVAMDALTDGECVNVVLERVIQGIFCMRPRRHELACPCLRRKLAELLGGVRRLGGRYPHVAHVCA